MAGTAGRRALVHRARSGVSRIYPPKWALNGQVMLGVPAQNCYTLACYRHRKFAPSLRQTLLLRRQLWAASACPSFLALIPDRALVRGP